MYLVLYPLLGKEFGVLEGKGPGPVVGLIDEPLEILYPLGVGVLILQGDTHLCAPQRPPWLPGIVGTYIFLV